MSTQEGTSFDGMLSHRRRYSFHPLSKFPGPRLWAFTRIPHHISTWKGVRNQSVRELHNKYGHVVRINPDELSFTDPNAWKDVYGHGTKGTTGSVPHKNWATYGQSPNGVKNLLQARDNDHSRMRKIFTPAFSDRALKQQEPLFVRYADQLVSRLLEGTEANPDQKWDMVKMYNFTTFDVMGDLTFGEPLHMLDNAEYDPWVKVIFSSIKYSAKLGILKSYPRLWRAFKTLVPETGNKKRINHFLHSVTRVTKRLEKGREHEGVDLWDLVLSQKEGKGLSRGEMDANASLFMLAGTETTATLVSGLTYFLLTKPDMRGVTRSECMKKLAGEIRGTFTSADGMTMERLAALPYLAACIKEAFRLYPPVPLEMPRITPKEGSTILGQFVPPNTAVAIPQHATYTHKKNFKMPMEYIPERWLGDSRFDSDEKLALQPFSVGSRDCVGKNLANHEIRLIIAKVIYSFDLELAPESNEWTDQLTFILWEKKPLMCKLHAVK
ncbi:cytochrome P450 monooxygenase-like protein [Cucurbitaria berberidis CBS 394.84]|uniref:Cytochrome P450 monooxygenase-like protein n=1 Tax=Cucurbitaria berberidis CBS 394.84 TaxID=1168544 RepID=A0A9P4GB21_9PLEO|nr:cytochrome P450 monooxygenase-like protein [Cucurbitaria berberidis CBS 394.84]KAF1841975.1 cytochrome P450 monooxygenase-like protein [Cucurbitaria berberidis CBS 394.84]